MVTVKGKTTIASFLGHFHLKYPFCLYEIRTMVVVRGETGRKEEVLVVAAIDLGVFMISHQLDKYLTNERIMVLEKLPGIFLAVLAIQLIINGLVDLHIITSVAH